MTKSKVSKSRNKRQKNGFGLESTSGASEGDSIGISQLLQRFLASDDQVYTFEANLSNHQRAMVHLKCRKMGLISKSSGKGTKRCVSVYKSKKKSKTFEGKENVSVLTFSGESQGIVMDFFLHYPPGEDEAGKQNISKYISNSHKSRGIRDDFFRMPLMKRDEIVKKAELLASKVDKSPKLREISEKRSKLPIASFKDVIISMIENHQVVLISGETGCGKTTQVPQFLLDYMWAKGKNCKIICTQPRRISAMSVAERISQERGENIGENVGYKIRLDSKGGRHSSILFCTNGILLRVLVSGGTNGMDSTENDISELTHIIVDEIHERDRFSDLMLTILRDLLPVYPHLHLVLMSATLDAERFSQYFGGCPIIRVPGFTHPVQTFYLEEVLSLLKSPMNLLNASSSTCPSEELNLSEDYQGALDEAIEMACSTEEFDPLLELISSEGTTQVLNYQHTSTGVTPLMVLAGKGKLGDICSLLSLGADCHLQAKDGSTALDWANRGDQPETAEIIRKHIESNSTCSKKEEEQELLEKYMSNINPEFIDVILIEKLLRKICSESKDGAVLVFLPGWEDIKKARDRLLANPFFDDATKFLILSLHSKVPPAEQKEVFKRPPPGCRKIILSTNISETSVTIDDVVYVVDSGRMKEKNYDPYSNVSTLQSSWISKASAKQREGRAGRCQPGICYHLYSKLRAVSLAEFQVPEIKRMRIEDLCLQVKMIDPNCKIDDFMKKTLDPPVKETIKNAIAILQDIGALSLDECLTELGEKLGSLPVHPLTCKMLFFAILLNCLDPALTLACAADYRDPFTLPMFPDEKKRADAAKAELASLYGGYSDQLAVIAAFDCWRRAKEKGQASQFCSEYFVSSTTMSRLSSMRKQLQNELVRGGYIRSDVSTCSMNARDPGIVRSVIVAGLYPKIGRLHPAPKYGRQFFVETANGNKVRLHPQSITSKLSFKKPDGRRPLLVYDEVTRGDGGLHTRNCTIIGPVPLLLLATEIVVAPGKDKSDDEEDDDGDRGSDADEDEVRDETEMEIEKSSKLGKKIMSSPDNAVTVVVDRWLSFESTALEVAQIYCLRERLSTAILFKAINPRKVLPSVLGASIYAIACLLAYDGLAGISLPMESIDSLTSMVSATEIGKSSTSEKRPDQAPNSFLQSLFMNGSSHHNGPSHGQASSHTGARPMLVDSQVIPMHGSSHRNVRRHKARNNALQKGKLLVQARPPTVTGPMLIDSPITPTHTRRSIAHKPVQDPEAPMQLIPAPRPVIEGLIGYGLDMYGPFGPRGDSSKRPHGNRSG